VTQSLKWLLIGASNIAEQVLPAILQVPGQQAVGVYSRSAERAKAFAAQFQIPQAGTDLPALLAATRADVAYVSSTNELHHTQTLQALAAGCHVLCEKPLAMSLADARQMVQTARDKGRVLATNHHLRAHAAHQWIREAVAQGKIGRLHSVQVSHAVYLPPHLQGWRLNQPGAGGGVTMDILVHDVDLLRYLTQRNPLSVQCLTQNHGMAVSGLDDSSMSLLEFQDQVLAQVHVSFVAKHGTTRLHVLGTEGNIYAEDSLSQSGQARMVLSNQQGRTEIPVEKRNLYVPTITALVNAITGKGQPLASGQDGLVSMATALAALQAAREGRKLPLQF
jgi:1,5-anhydro-D-fructose reductase (1,5-anhydro-D-mannitol-forming)